MNEALRLPSSSQKLTARSSRTRAKLVATAERLFAEKGLNSVSLAEINKTANQRNRNACLYHFVNREGLLQAILDKHVPTIMTKRADMLEAHQKNGELTIREAVRVFLYSVAWKLDDEDGGPAFIRIIAQLIVAYAIAADNFEASPLLRFTQPEPILRSLEKSMAPLMLPKPIVTQRLMMAAIMMFHSMADHLQLRQQTGAVKIHDTPLFLANLEDAMVGLLSAGMSEQTRALL